MANLSSDGKYVTVERDDTLSQIAATYKDNTSPKNATYQQLASWNNISNPNKIYVGQKIYLSKSGSSSSSSTTTKTNSNCVTNVTLGLLADSDNTLLATWKWHKESTTESYQILWKYKTFDNKWLVGEETSNSVSAHYYATSRQSEYSIPSNAKQIAFRVKPIAKKKKNSKGEETKTAQWTAKWIDWKYYTVGDELKQPEKPEIKFSEFDGLKLEMTLSYDKSAYATKAQFQIYKNGSTHVAKSPELAINKETKKVSWSYTIAAGNVYTVRAKVIGSGLDSAWSDFSEEAKAIPTSPSKITQCKEYEGSTSMDSYSVYLAWDKVASATGYKIQYANDKSILLDMPQQAKVEEVKSQSDINPTPPTTWVISELDAGEYFFRICATNDGGSSEWTDIVSLKLGEPPGIPTTWSSTTKAVVGETIRLYWIHNSLDGSTQRYCGFNILVDGEVLPITDAIANAADTDKTPTKLIYSYPLTDSYFRVYRIYDYISDSTQLYAELDTNSFINGVKIKWKVRTAGLTKEFGDYSTEREIDVYPQPNLELTVTDQFEEHDGTIVLSEVPMDVLESFPFYVKAEVKPVTQTPLGYHLSVTALDSYETVDQVGNVKMVSVGDEVYAQNFDISDILLFEFSAGNIDLENGIRYAIKCVASLDSGLSAEATTDFLVSWSEEHYTPNAEYTLDTDTYSLSIRPYCEDTQLVYRAVEKSSNEYSVTDESIDESLLEDVYTASGERVLLGINSNGSEIYYCIAYVNSSGAPIDPTYYRVVRNSDGTYSNSSKLSESSVTNRYTVSGEEVYLGVISGNEILYSSVEIGELVENITLSVYRREFDGSFTEIATGLDNTNNTFVTDPHPALDYGRYRIVAKSNSNGAVSYYDPPGFPIGGKAVIIQWDEEWSSFEGWSEDSLAEPPWTGSLLTLPYNIDVSDTTNPDVSHVKYVGRKHPVSYHGTHLGETATWNVAVPKEDTETLYQLRRLKAWMGNVYVREPSGTGYWATITATDPRNHGEVTVSVALNITRVEGGI